jgi:hypothetical protein
MLQAASSGSSEAFPPGAAVGVASGYETSSSSASVAGGEEGGATSAGSAAAAAAVMPVDPEMQQLLQLQYPSLHELVVETALRMHGGSLQAAAQFLAVLDQQEGQLGPVQVEHQQRQQPTLGNYLQHLLPEAAAPPAAAAGYDWPASNSNTWADSSSEYHAGGKQQASARRAGPGRSWQPPPPPPPPQQQQFGSGKGKAGRRSSSGTAGDDPMSVSERQAMNVHMTAKRIYLQASPGRPWDRGNHGCQAALAPLLTRIAPDSDLS